MTRWLGLTGLLAALLLVGSGSAADDNDPPKPAKKTNDLEELFKKLDANGDGKLSLEEFKKLEQFYKPRRQFGGGGFQFGQGGLNPEKLKKLLEGFGGGGGFDPETLKKLLDRFGGAGGFDFDPDMLKGLFDQFGQPGKKGAKKAPEKKDVD